MGNGYLYDMEYTDAKETFLNAWGSLGSSWGINRTMAQIHALLLLSTEPLSTEDVMKELNISRGNANMNLRALIDWGIVTKEFKSGERREYFRSGKNIWELARQIARERKKRELEPILRVMDQFEQLEGANQEQTEEFKKVTADIKEFTLKAGNMLDNFIQSDKHWFLKLFNLTK